MKPETSQLIAHYEQLALLTEQMRAAAEQGEWDQLVELELRRSQVLEEVKPMDATLTLDAAGLRHRGEYINHIITLDGAIRELVQKHMGQIQLNLASDQNTHRLRQAYGL